MVDRAGALALPGALDQRPGRPGRDLAALQPDLVEVLRRVERGCPRADDHGRADDPARLDERPRVGQPDPDVADEVAARLGQVGDEAGDEDHRREQDQPLPPDHRPAGEAARVEVAGDGGQAAHQQQAVDVPARRDDPAELHDALTEEDDREHQDARLEDGLEEADRLGRPLAVELGRGEEPAEARPTARRTGLGPHVAVGRGRRRTRARIPARSSSSECRARPDRCRPSRRPRPG